MRSTFTILLILLSMFASTALYAEVNNYTVIHDRTTNATIFVFKADRGDVYFNHDLHQLNMKDEACIPCHKTTTPTKESTLTRLDQRMAHYFCKGCHKKAGKGPTECHECHKTKH